MHLYLLIEGKKNSQGTEREIVWLEYTTDKI